MDNLNAVVVVNRRQAEYRRWRLAFCGGKVVGTECGGRMKKMWLDDPLHLFNEMESPRVRGVCAIYYGSQLPTAGGRARLEERLLVVISLYLHEVSDR